MLRLSLNYYAELSLTEFCVGYLVIINRLADKPRPSFPKQQLVIEHINRTEKQYYFSFSQINDTGILIYQWSAVTLYHDKVHCSMELGLISCSPLPRQKPHQGLTRALFCQFSFASVTNCHIQPPSFILVHHTLCLCHSFHWNPCLLCTLVVSTRNCKLPLVLKCLHLTPRHSFLTGSTSLELGWPVGYSSTYVSSYFFIFKPWLHLILMKHYQLVLRPQMRTWHKVVTKGRGPGISPGYFHR